MPVHPPSGMSSATGTVSWTSSARRRPAGGLGPVAGVVGGGTAGGVAGPPAGRRRRRRRRRWPGAPGRSRRDGAVRGDPGAGGDQSRRAAPSSVDAEAAGFADRDVAADQRGRRPAQLLARPHRRDELGRLVVRLHAQELADGDAARRSPSTGRPTLRWNSAHRRRRSGRRRSRRPGRRRSRARRGAAAARPRRHRGAWGSGARAPGRRAGIRPRPGSARSGARRRRRPAGRGGAGTPRPRLAWPARRCPAGPRRWPSPSSASRRPEVADRGPAVALREGEDGAGVPTGRPRSPGAAGPWASPRPGGPWARRP